MGQGSRGDRERLPHPESQEASCGQTWKEVKVKQPVTKIKGGRMVRGISRAGPGMASDELSSNSVSVHPRLREAQTAGPCLPDRPNHQIEAAGAKGNLGSPGKLPPQSGDGS